MRSLLIAIVVALACNVGAAEIRVRNPATRPAAMVKPATGPVMLAEVSPQVQEQLLRIATAYRQARSLDLAGVVRMRIVEDGANRDREAGFAGTFLAPGFFRHQTQNEPLAIGTGKKAILFIERERIYEQSDVPEGPGIFEKLTATQREVIACQNPSLALALAADAGEALRRMCKKIDLADDARAGDVDCFVLKVESRDMDGPAELKFDKATGLLREMVADLTESVKKAGRPDISSVRYTVEYRTVRAGVELKPEAFAFTVPSGARDRTEVATGMEADGGDHSVLVGQPAPDFSLEDLDGNLVKLADLKGSVVVLDFWATWCGPCRAAMPALNAIYERHKAAGLKVYVVNQQEPKDKVARFIDGAKLTMPALLDLKGSVGRQYHVSGLPTTVIIGPDGTVKHVHVGFGGSLDELERQVQSLLKP